MIKKQTFVVVILAVIVCIETFALVRRPYTICTHQIRNETTSEKTMPEDDITRLISNIESLNRHLELQSYNKHWLDRHLNNLLIKIEREKGLKPIAIEPLVPASVPVPPSEPRFPRFEKPFCKPYSTPEKHLSEKSMTKQTLQHINQHMRLTAMSVGLSVFGEEQKLRNYEKRLERLQD